MKRLSTIAAILSVLIGSSVFAGIDYIKYNEDFRARESTAPSSEPGKRLEHKSRYQREHQEGTEVPAQEKAKPANKYERNNWDPQEK